MNKKAQQHALETPAKIFLIGLVLVLLIVVGLDLLKKASGSPIGIFDSWLEALGFGKEEKDLTTLNEQAQENFNLLVQEHNTCSASQNKDCKCQGGIGFNSFSNIHALQVNDNEIRLLIVKDGNELTKDLRALNMPKCYTTRTSFNTIKNPSMITFTEDGPVLEDSNGKDLEFRKGSFFVFYKNPSNEICWFTKDKSLLTQFNTC